MNIPIRPADKRPNDVPYYIDKTCKKCGSTLVYEYALLDNEVAKEERWYDEFMCPKCKDVIYLDAPKVYKDDR